MRARHVQQKGFSIISLMIGVLISAIVVAGMMISFQNMSQVASEATSAASLDGQRMSGLMAASRLMQNAAYGITGTVSYGNHVVVLSSASITGDDLDGTVENSRPALGNAIIWMEDNDNDTSVNNAECRGLLWNTNWGLSRIAVADCSAVTDLSLDYNDSGLDWTVQSLISDVPDALEAEWPDDAAVNTRVTVRQFTPPDGCDPFGIATVNGVLTSSLSTTVSSNDNAGNPTPVSVLTCLANLNDTNT